MALQMNKDLTPKHHKQFYMQGLIDPHQLLKTH